MKFPKKHKEGGGGGSSPAKAAQKVFKKPTNAAGSSSSGGGGGARKKADDNAPEVVRNKSVLSSVLSHGNEPGVKVIQGVRIEDLVVGTGRRAESGKKVKVHYVGKFKSNDRVFDASKNRPFQFRLGRSEVIQGWDIGVNGMQVGGKRRLTIPPEKAYGKSGAPPTIPGNATLVFEVSLLEVV